jgi:DmsE family decaheme c-type cytochrome
LIGALCAVGFLLAGTVATSATAADFAAAGNEPAKARMAEDAKCTTCHNEAWRKPVLSIYQTPHGNRADARAPVCTSCHGRSEGHQKDPGGTEPDVVFAGDDKAAADTQNGVCLTCHKSDANRTLWMGSTHQDRGVACTNCHQVHTPNDKVRDKLTQPEVCFACHKEQRTQVNKPSHHPIPEGKMACSDCHNPHGSAGPKLMKRDSVNDTCYTCHMEKRGPFVHNHEPVSEDCTNCHNPHGTTAENLLKARPPFLCHQCHTPNGPNVGQIVGQGQERSFGGGAAQLSATTGGKSGINYFMARGCVNCHTQVHGTNNPSTANPSPQFNFR